MVRAVERVVERGASVSANKIYTIDEINNLSDSEFTDLLGGVYEHSKWVAERALAKRPFANRDQLESAMKDCVLAATDQEQLGILCAHPEFAGVASVELTESSTAEQTSLSLNALPPEQHATMQQFNKRFMAKFGFPGIVAVRLQKSVEGIFAEFERRLDNNSEAEKIEALNQVYSIVRFRLHDLIDDSESTRV